MIEASVDMLKSQAEKEWFFGNKEKERIGPHSFPEVSFTEQSIGKHLELSYHEFFQKLGEVEDCKQLFAACESLKLVFAPK